MILRCVGAPFLIFINKPAQIFSPYRAVKRADHFNIKSCCFFQGRLNLSSVFTYNVSKISSGFFQPLCLKVQLVCKNISVQRAKGSKGVCTVKNFIISIISHHSLRPVNHWDHGKCKGVFSCGNGISLFDHNCTVIYVKIKKLFHHGKCLCISHKFHFRITNHNFCKRSAVIRLHVIHNNIIQSTAVQYMLQILKEL